ncbi:protein HEXIM [Lingula anatina]|uniref:Protein HEXIM n=1 Tax=Lingula anatina TaxID=7574 RepID=A0A1S3JLJ1_LINAN|nr:protein HEXIM [Lingula anatina]|eukprot:XP_013411280.1 protein HEXIM [Lingula anatina]
MVDRPMESENVSVFVTDNSLTCPGPQPLSEVAVDDVTEVEGRPGTRRAPRAEKRGSEEMDEGSSGENGVSGKKKHRRKRKAGKHHNNRKWKPYNKLSWEERKALEDREAVRANQKRQDRFNSGHPVAPYNTTQFLMEDHEDPNIKNLEEDETLIQQNRQNSNNSMNSYSQDSSDEYFYDSPNDEEIFLAKDFTETYDNIHAERLESMSKGELVREYLAMETKLEQMEKKVKRLESVSPLEETGSTTSSNGRTETENFANNNQTDLLADDNDRVPQISASKLKSPEINDYNRLQQEIRQLREENCQLARENKGLSTQDSCT